MSQGFQGGEGHEDSGLHVEYAGAVETAFALLVGHVGQGAEGPDGVEVAEQEDGFAGVVSRKNVRKEVELEDVSVGGLGVAGDDGIQWRGEGGEGVCGGVDGGW